MKKSYLILILVLVLLGSGIGILIGVKKKKEPSTSKEEEETTPLKSPVKTEIPKDLVTKIHIDYVDTNKRELAYSMHYKGISHQGVFKDGDKDTFVIKSLGRFVVVQPRTMTKESDAISTPQTGKGGKLSSVTQPIVTAISAGSFYENSFVYLAIYNNKQLVTGLKVNLHTGEQIKGLPTEWEQLED